MQVAYLECDSQNKPMGSGVWALLCMVMTVECDSQNKPVGSGMWALLCMVMTD